MLRFLLRDCLGFGFGLWLLGYVLGIVFFALVPAALIGWFVLPLGLAATLLTLWRFVKIPTLARGFVVGVGWTLIAVVGDYFAILRLLCPPDGYYKADVYIYYGLTLTLPIAAGAWAGRKR